MDLHPILEPGDLPKAGLWYVLSPRGQPPPVTVGHTCTHLAASGSRKMGRVLVVGGANPEASFKHTAVLDLDSYEWDFPEWCGLEPRYEHAAFLVAPSAPPAESSPGEESSPAPGSRGACKSGAEAGTGGNRRASVEDPPPPPSPPTPPSVSSSPAGLWVFGGADRTGNRNCVQRLDLEQRRWESPPQVGGTPPCPRTYHSGAAAVGGTLYVVGGGSRGTSAVRDTRLYAFDSASRRWSCPDTAGPGPSPRQGHAVASLGSGLYVHGGVDGADFLSDLHALDTVSLRWERLRCRGDVPSPRAAHSAVAHGRALYVFGGLGPTGALSCTYKYHVDERRWTLVELGCSPPTPRLDHAACVIPWVARRGRPDTPEPSRDATGASVAVAGTSSPPPPPPPACADPSRPGSPPGNSAGAARVVSQERPIGDVGEAGETGEAGDVAATVALCLVFGGMDGEGEIFNDCVALLLD